MAQTTSQLGRIVTDGRVSPNRKQQMMIQTRELEALQARIREAEERLKAQSYHSSSASQTERSEQDQTDGKDGSL